MKGLAGTRKHTLPDVPSQAAPASSRRSIGPLNSTQIVALILIAAIIVAVITFSSTLNSSQQTAFTNAMHSLANFDVGKAVEEIGKAGGVDEVVDVASGQGTSKDVKNAVVVVLTDGIEVEPDGKKKNYSDETFTIDALVEEKFQVWDKRERKDPNTIDGKESTSQSARSFFDPTPNIAPLNLSQYHYLRQLGGNHKPLYPSSLRDYRHTYGNCKGKFRRDMSYSKSELSTGANADLTARMWPNIPDRRAAFPTEHERCHAVMIRQLAILASILDRYNMTNWFISHATLLGAVRHGGMIPWDVDIDVVMTRSTTRFLRKIWRREFPRDMFLQTEKTDPSFHLWIGDDRGARIKDRYSGFHGFDWTHYNPKTKRKKKIKRYQNGAGVDIIPINRVSKKGEQNKDKMKVFHSYFNVSDVFPTSKICFENFEVRAPKDPEWFLDLIYGKGWRELPEHPIFAAPTAQPCVSTSPVRGSAWNLNWALDHPLAANKSQSYPQYVPRTSTPAEEIKAQADRKASGLGPKAAKFELEAGDILSPNDQDSESNDGIISNSNKNDKQKPLAVYPLAGAKLFPRGDPHGTFRDDGARPYMKYDPKGKVKYTEQQNMDERSG